MEYSAGFTNEGWFQSEINTVLQYKKKGLSRTEILEKVIEENLFQLRSVSSIKGRFQKVYRRSETYNIELAQFFIHGSRLDQKALVLYSYLKCFRLPHDFFNEVLLYNYSNNSADLQSVEFDFFIERKEEEFPQIAGWRPETKKRLRSSMLMFFKESGLLQEENIMAYRITPIYISPKLKEYAINNDKLLQLLSELRGERK